jgi:hypothetical protein
MTEPNIPSRAKNWRLELGDTYVLGLSRVALGGMVFWVALGWARELVERGYFGDVFHVAFLPEACVPSRLTYTGVLASMLLLSALGAVGHRARLALGIAAALGVYVLLCDRLQFHHNRYALFCFAGLLSLSPCDRSFLITGSLESPASRTGPLWAQRLAQAQLSLIYLASGGGKLLDADWRDGLVLADRLTRYSGQALSRGVPAAIVDLLANPTGGSALAKIAIATELFLAIGLWSRRTRVYALWWGVWFHLTIELTSRVELFTWLTFAAYALFVTPDVHARKFFFDPSRPKAALYARLVRLLDWFARFEVVAWQPDALRTGHSLVIVRRDGSRATGVRAFAMVARCIPALFPLWAPIALWASFTKGGEASARA